jgi:cbb3-type cytochrome oxidase subunit 3
MFATMLHWVQLHSVVMMIVVFSLIVITAYWPGRRDSLQQDAMIPLRDDPTA